MRLMPDDAAPAPREQCRRRSTPPRRRVAATANNSKEGAPTIIFAVMLSAAPRMLPRFADLFWMPARHAEA
jgi:hypothetical protein